LSGNPGYAERLIKRDFDYLAACYAAERAAITRARRGKALVGGLVLLLALGAAGWWKQDLLREQYGWRVIMRPSVLTAEQEHALREKQEYNECASRCPTMVVVPPGTSIMGSPGSEKDRSENEGPQHEVKIAVQFAVSKFDVTFDEWDQCTTARACPRASDIGWGRGNRP
jgi:formylglycine-generating enzyme required for sulfatase activity